MIMKSQERKAKSKINIFTKKRKKISIFIAGEKFSSYACLAH